MKKGEVIFIVYTFSGDLLKVTDISSVYRKDIKLIIKRTFIKVGGEIVTTYYFKNQVLDPSFRIVRNNVFTWDNLRCKLDKYEKWGKVDLSTNNYTVVMGLTVTDLFKRKGRLRYSSKLDHSNFELLQSDLHLLNRVGGYEAFIEIQLLLKENSRLKLKLEKLKQKNKN